VEGVTGSDDMILRNDVYEDLEVVIERVLGIYISALHIVLYSRLRLRI
jgi:hypothetical protein